MKKVTQVETDDPVKNKFTLVIKGPVKKIVDIKPAYVRLKGYQGETLETFVRLTPSQSKTTALIFVISMTDYINKIPQP